MSSSTSPLLRHLDAPVRFLSFTMGELVGYLAPFFLGALVDSVFFVPVGGLMGIVLAKKGVKRFPRFFGIRFLYWALPTKSFNRLLRVSLPSSNQRLWVK